jgi:hypothetical protein
MKIPNSPMFVPAHPPDAPLLHWRWPYTEPTECGLRVGPSTISAWDVTCRACLDALGVEVDDRTDAQKARDLAGALWRMETGRE